MNIKYIYVFIVQSINNSQIVQRSDDNNFLIDQKLQQQNLMNLSHEYFLRNIKSNLDFPKFLQAPPDPQKDLIYTYKCQLSQTLKQKSSFNNIQTKTYQNKIYMNDKKEFKVNVYQYGNKNQKRNQCYDQFWRINKKFRKPYGLSTKYVDTINKNIQLIRKCQFTTSNKTNQLQLNSIHKNKTETSQTQPTKQHRNTFLKPRYHHKPSFLSTTKHQDKVYQTHSTSGKIDAFDRTIRNQSAMYKDLLSRQRQSKKDYISLHNSMNKMLAAEMINLNINKNVKVRNSTFQA